MQAVCHLLKHAPFLCSLSLVRVLDEGLEVGRPTRLLSRLI